MATSRKGTTSTTSTAKKPVKKAVKSTAEDLPANESGERAPIELTERSGGPLYDWIYMPIWLLLQDFIIDWENG